VVINSAVFIIFAFSFFKPRTRRDWRSFGSFAAFIVALFVEMYGFPLTIYFLSGWLQTRFPGVEIMQHDSGHLWFTALGIEGNPHTHPIHLLANAFIVVGFLLLSGAWKILWAAQRSGQLATTGVYARIRHPQYVAFISIMFGFLVMWPTILTLAMFPILVIMYVRLALREEKEVAEQFPEEWPAYAQHTPRWFPRLSKPPR
jgi:protein-S-isoprenylcysteine O-methyltransferase Ste14